MKYILLLLFSPILFAAQSYCEFLVKVNTSTGNLARIDSLKGIKYKRVLPPAVTIDKTNDRLYFVGMNSASVQSLYSANMTTGAIRKHGASPDQANGLYNIGHFQFDDSTGYIYGLANNSTYKTVLFKMDTATAAITTLTVFQNLVYTPYRGYTYDQSKHRYIFIGYASGTGYPFLTVVSALTGSLLSSVQVTNNPFPFYIRYNNSTSTLYALFSNSSGTVTVASMNMLTGLPVQTVTTITNMTLQTMAFGPNRVSLDEVNNRLTIIEMKANPKLLTLDLATGNTLTSPTFTAGMTAPENVAEITYNNANGSLYALLWGPKATSNETVTINEASPSNDEVTIAPNPGCRSINLQVAEERSVNGIYIYNLNGQLIRKLDAEEITRKTSISQMEPGLYIMEVEVSGKRLKKKVIVN